MLRFLRPTIRTSPVRRSKVLYRAIVFQLPGPLLLTRLHPLHRKPQPARRLIAKADQRRRARGFRYEHEQVVELIVEVDQRGMAQRLDQLGDGVGVTYDEDATAGESRAESVRPVGGPSGRWFDRGDMLRLG